MLNWHKKEKPVLGVAGLGGGIGSKLTSGLNFEAGQVAFTTPGPHTWVAPEAAAHFGISIVVVGGGGGLRGRDPNSNYGAGGGGGGLRWRNAYPVTAGASYAIQVGAGGQNAPSSDPGPANGTPSYFVGPSVLYAEGGTGGRDSAESPGGGGSPTSSPLIGGGDGGYGYDSETSGGGHGGGGGAGGYSGNGGNAAKPGVSRTNGAGGAGGAGFGGGGGVGIFGEGPNGSEGFNNGQGGSGGTDGGYYASPTDGGKGGLYGGGAGCVDNSAPFPETYADGGGGAVRIIWGDGREFPSTLTGDDSTPAPA